MNKNYIKKVLEKEFDSKTEIKGFHKRKPSLIYEFTTNNKEYVLKIRKSSKLNSFKEIIKDRKTREASLKEWEGINYFYNLTKEKNIPIGFAKPIKYIKEIKGIVTEKIEGKDFWKELKNKKQSEEYKKEVLFRIGEGLGLLHLNTLEGEEKIKIKERETGDKELDKKIKNIIESYKNHSTPLAKVLPGFDIRDIFVNKNKDVFFFDPGGVDSDFIYKTLASLITTIKIVNQGEISFLFKEDRKEWEEELLKGYSTKIRYDRNLLNLFLLIRLLSQQKSAQRTFERRLISKFPFVEKIIKKLYIDRFYFKEIEKIIKNYGL